MRPRKAQDQADAIDRGMSEDELVALALGTSEEAVRKMRQGLAVEEKSPLTYCPAGPIPIRSACEGDTHRHHENSFRPTDPAL